MKIDQSDSILCVCTAARECLARSKFCASEAVVLKDRLRHLRPNVGFQEVPNVVVLLSGRCHLVDELENPGVHIWECSVQTAPHPSLHFKCVARVISHIMAFLFSIYHPHAHSCKIAFGEPRIDIARYPPIDGRISGD
jgi:hypothetical protein